MTLFARWTNMDSPVKPVLSGVEGPEGDNGLGGGKLARGHRQKARFHPGFSAKPTFHPLLSPLPEAGPPDDDREGRQA